MITIDSIFLNAGIQSVFDFTDPSKVDLEKFYREINVNFLSSVALAHAFLPFLLQKQTPTSLIFTTSNLAVVPAVKFPAYSASKAAMNAFVLCLRERLKNSNVKVIEISPPAVQTELHDYMGKDIGRNLGMPLNAFAEEAWKGLESGQDQIMVGTVGPEETFHGVVNQRRTLFKMLSRKILGED